MILLRYAITLFNVYFYYYSFYLVIFSFVCNTIYVSGNTNKQSLLSMLTAINIFFPPLNIIVFPLGVGQGRGRRGAHKSQSEFQNPLFHVLRRNPCPFPYFSIVLQLSLSLLQPFQPIFVSFVTMSYVTTSKPCRWFEMLPQQCLIDQPVAN